MDAHLNDLISRLAEAIGPDRELDAAIAEALSLIPQTHERAMNHGRPQAYYWHKHNHKGDYWTPPAYTASIDAALTLYIHKPDVVSICPRKVCADALRQRIEVLGQGSERCAE